MQLYLQITILVLSVFIIYFVWQLIRHGELRPAYGLLWLVAAILLFIITIFKDLVRIITDFFEVSHAPTVVIGLALVFITNLLLSHSVIISHLSRNNKELAQNIAILEWRLQNLENIEKHSLDAGIS